MKKLLLVITMGCLAFTLPQCKSKPKDADIKVEAEKALAADPACAGLNVSVNDGVATITGEVKDESTKTAAQSAVAGIKGVKSVENNATVYVPAPPVVPNATETQAAALNKAVSDAVKDFPGVTATVKDQVVVLTGEIAKSNLQKLMMSLNSLKSMGLKSIDSKGLVKK
ncbi:MAG TPA: BON domain-containing protein [Chitinophagaceae bacterium]|nr:BON domain-containing protein [Chitinophagaceae bacterium]